jgi:hypothetical protein
MVDPYLLKVVNGIITSVLFFGIFFFFFVCVTASFPQWIHIDVEGEIVTLSKLLKRHEMIVLNVLHTSRKRGRRVTGMKERRWGRVRG